MSIEVKNLSYVYGKKTPYEKQALEDITFNIDEGDFVGIVGATGSGKSTLIQHFNGLIKLQTGELKVYDIDLSKKKPDVKKLRSGIGMLFQYPEYQLFADTVLDDVMFGPLNFGTSKEEALSLAKEAIEMVGLDFDKIKDRSPLEISGGQKRRVAIAGVLAYSPHILVLDEPTAGLDPSGKKEMLNLISNLRTQYNKTVIMVSHNMDEIARYAKRVIVLGESKLLYDTTPAQLFYDCDIASIGLDTPHVVKIVKGLAKRGIDLGKDIITEEKLVNKLICYLGNRKC
ncbi:MAG TPA: energy-coupling factor transporter ATPase [Clostridia bacterium]|nr:energy-coupling factor transporter ATPase [Clostridia bacterium]